MELEITPGERGEGYFYEISDKGQVLALGYYRLENHAKFYGDLALSIYNARR